MERLYDRIGDLARFVNRLGKPSRAKLTDAQKAERLNQFTAEMEKDLADAIGELMSFERLDNLEAVPDLQEFMASFEHPTQDKIDFAITVATLPVSITGPGLLGKLAFRMALRGGKSVTDAVIRRQIASFAAGASMEVGEAALTFNLEYGRAVRAELERANLHKASPTEIHQFLVDHPDIGKDARTKAAKAMIANFLAAKFGKLAGKGAKGAGASGLGVDAVEIITSTGIENILGNR